ncbi:transcription factor bHLH143-like [Senna tora]|uniref:Transcription factor bHLH143-like n=1 Tax=Senna tora TaxID=362788 RepID=A0A834U176_9FABA|nr:transcription factor bHLH143-like [Senna tora]
MGEDCGTWIPQLHFDWQSPNLSSFGASLDVGKQNDNTSFMNSGIDMVSRNATMPDYAPSVLPSLQLGQSNEPHGWSYCLPRFRQAFMPAPNFGVEDKLADGQGIRFREEIAANGISGLPQKQLIVIDQTFNKTTFVYRSSIGSPIECLASWQSKLNGPNNMNGNEPSARRDLNHPKGPTLTGKVGEIQGTEVQSEMHEDTEEINALLYSDSDGYSTEDDEVTSTGHSPSTMTSHDNQDIFWGSNEEVASSAGKTKKRKLSDDGAYDGIQLVDSASSLNPNGSFANGDDAESRCSSCNIQGSGNKKMRKERIRDVLNILQTIIPGGKERDPIGLLDEAIRCLKSLKLKAKALGLHDL